jgi:L-iditol 2-dehydrogenase
VPTNLAAFVLENRRIELGPIETPAPQPHEVLLKVIYCGVCGSDVHFYSHGEPEFPDVYPFIIGHEFSAEVVEVGAEVTHLQLGDRVSVEPGIPCRVCTWCAAGKYNLCPKITFLSAPRALGGMRNYLAHPAALCHVLPENVSSLEGALIEPLAVGMYAVQTSGATVGNTVAILGAGCIGLVTLLSLRAAGVRDITVVDLHQVRLDKALALGASRVVNASETDPVKAVSGQHQGYGPEFVFETAGSRVTAAQTVDMVQRGGTIMIVGNVVGETPFNFQQFANKELQLRSIFRYRNIFPTAIAAVTSGQIDITDIVSTIFPFEEAQQAFEDSISHQQTMVKAVIQVGEP